jgi:hypothetical protein
MYLRYNEQTNCWDVAVNTRDGRRKVSINTTNWVYSGKAVDTSEAWDWAAKTALSFSIHEDERNTDNDICTSEHLAVNKHGAFHIGRSFKTAYPGHRHQPPE